VWSGTPAPSRRRNAAQMTSPGSGALSSSLDVVPLPPAGPAPGGIRSGLRARPVFELGNRVSAHLLIVLGPTLATGGSAVDGVAISPVEDHVVIARAAVAVEDVAPRVPTNPSQVSGVVVYELLEHAAIVSLAKVDCTGVSLRQLSGAPRKLAGMKPEPRISQDLIPQVDMEIASRRRGLARLRTTEGRHRINDGRGQSHGDHCRVLE